MLRNQALEEHNVKPIEALQRIGFGEPVIFNTPREKTKKDRERLPNGSRVGIFLSQPHSGLAQVLGFQNERIVIWLVHPSLVSPADVGLAATLYRSCAYFATSYDDNDIRELIVSNRGKVGPEKLFSYPYLPTDSDDVDTDNSVSSDDDERPARGRPKRLRNLLRPSTPVKRRV